MKSPLAELGATINEINTANGWDVMRPTDWPGPEDHDELEKVRKIGTGLCLIHTEVSEAMEAIRHRDDANFAEEMADVLIRTLDMAYGLGIDLDDAVAKKLEKNRLRGIRHGGKLV